MVQPCLQWDMLLSQFLAGSWPALQDASHLPLYLTHGDCTLHSKHTHHTVSNTNAELNWSDYQEAVAVFCLFSLCDLAPLA